MASTAKNAAIKSEKGGKGVLLLLFYFAFEKEGEEGGDDITLSRERRNGGIEKSRWIGCSNRNNRVSKTAVYLSARFFLPSTRRQRETYRVLDPRRDWAERDCVVVVVVESKIAIFFSKKFLLYSFLELRLTQHDRSWISFETIIGGLVSSSLYYFLSIPFFDRSGFLLLAPTKRSMTGGQNVKSLVWSKLE